MLYCRALWFSTSHNIFLRRWNAACGNRSLCINKINGTPWSWNAYLHHTPQHFLRRSNAACPFCFDKLVTLNIKATRTRMQPNLFRRIYAWSALNIKPELMQRMHAFDKLASHIKATRTRMQRNLFRRTWHTSRVVRSVPASPFPSRFLFRV